MQNVSTLHAEVDIVDSPRGVQLVLEAEGTLAAAVTVNAQQPHPG